MDNLCRFTVASLESSAYRGAVWRGDYRIAEPVVGGVGVAQAPANPALGLVGTVKAWWAVHRRACTWCSVAAGCFGGLVVWVVGVVL